MHAVWVSPEQLKTGMATMREQAMFLVHTSASSCPPA